ncbi:alanine--tRNA ligase-related protein [Jhaorihella thermophila]
MHRDLFFDHGEKYWGGPPGTPEEDGDRFVEIWNLVFMQYEQFEDGSRRELEKAVDRHRHGDRTGRGAIAGHQRQLCHRPDARADRGQRPRHQHRSRRAGQGASPSDRGPSALDLVPDCRRGDAFERRARLCAAADHAPGDATCASAGRKGSADAPGWCRNWCARWAGPIRNSARRRR